MPYQIHAIPRIRNHHHQIRDISRDISRTPLPRVSRRSVEGLESLVSLVSCHGSLPCRPRLRAGPITFHELVARAHCGPASLARSSA
jgi:hypothetical protein